MPPVPYCVQCRTFLLVKEIEDTTNKELSVLLQQLCTHHGAASELVAAAESPSPSATVRAAILSLTGVESGEDGSVAAVGTGQGSMSHYYTLDGAWELPDLFYSVQALRRFGVVTMYWPHGAHHVRSTHSKMEREGGQAISHR